MRSTIALFACILLLTATAMTSASLIPDLGDWLSFMPLFSFMNKPNPDYSWSLVSEESVPASHTTYLAHMTSQKYLTEQDVDRTLWEHDLLCVVPSQLDIGHRALLVSLGNDNGEAISGSNKQLLTGYAIATKSTVCAVFQSLNQPLRFALQVAPNGTVTEWTNPLVEDAIIAHMWNKYIETGDNKYMVRFAMVKSISKAMDTVQALISQVRSPSDKPHSFIVAGASKHGWSTHLAAAADRRISGIIPIVIDIPNTLTVLKRTHATLCTWPLAMYDYVAAGLTNKIDTPEFASLATLEDPLTYSLFTMGVRKFHHSATSDQFFITDAATQYFGQLSGFQNAIRYHPNGGHGFYDFLAAYSVFLHDKTLPKLSWTLVKKSSTSFELTATTYNYDPQGQPQQVKLWQASNAQARDFRLPIPGIPGQPDAPIWTSSTEDVTKTVSIFGTVTWKATVQVPENTGFKGLFLEFTYPNPVNNEQLPPLVLTTTAYVVPEDLPCN